MKRFMVPKVALSLLVPLAISLAGARDAGAQVGVSVEVTPPEADVVVAPPAAYIATTEPEYFEGRPVYFYNNYWYYRDGYGRWSYYRSEPAYLRGRREHWGWRGTYGRAGWGHDHYARGGGYVGGGGYARGGYVRHSGAFRAGGPARYHYRR